MKKIDTYSNSNSVWLQLHCAIHFKDCLSLYPVKTERLKLDSGQETNQALKIECNNLESPNRNFWNVLHTSFSSDARKQSKTFHCVLRACKSFKTPGGRPIKFVYSEKATKFCEIFTLLLSTVHAKVSRSRKHIILSSHIPKNQRKFSSKSGRIQKIKVL